MDSMQLIVGVASPIRTTAGACNPPTIVRTALCYGQRQRLVSRIHQG
jgi:hypothetical protein